MTTIFVLKKKFNELHNISYMIRVPYHPNKNLSKEQMESIYKDLSINACRLNEITSELNIYKNNLFKSQSLERNSTLVLLNLFEQDIHKAKVVVQSYKSGLINDYNNKIMVNCRPFN